jgi:hypothetical protein
VRFATKTKVLILFMGRQIAAAIELACNRLGGAMMMRLFYG